MGLKARFKEMPGTRLPTVPARNACGALRAVILMVLTAVLVYGQPCRAGQMAEKQPAQPLSPEERLRPVLGIPYRDDGVQDLQGNYTLFARPEARFASSGLNCSGFVLAAARILLDSRLSPAEAGRDRLGDSGEDAVRGKDWDFGWDVILNISEGHPRRMLLPRDGTGAETMDPAESTGAGPLGYPLTAPETWAELQDRVLPGHLYLLSFNKPAIQKPYDLLHYHVGILLRGSSGELLLCQTTSQSGVSSCRNMADPGVARTFRKHFADRRGLPKRMVVLEAPLPAR